MGGDRQDWGRVVEEKVWGVMGEERWVRQNPPYG